MISEFSINQDNEKIKRLKKLLKDKKPSKDKLEQYLLYEHSFYQLKRIITGYNIKILLYAFEHIQIHFKRSKYLYNGQNLILRRIVREAEKRWKLLFEALEK